MAWLTGYAYRAKIPCTATAAGAQTAYTKKLVIVQGSGTNAAGTIYLNSHALNWPNDVRFTKSDGSTALDFYREESDATDGTWHVELDSIGAAGDTDFYCYYGKTSDTDASNGANTFQFFDDFEAGNLNKWTSAGEGWTAQNTTKSEGSYAAKSTGYSWTDFYKTQDFGSVIIRSKVRFSNSAQQGTFTPSAGHDLHSGSWLAWSLVMQLGRFQYVVNGSYTNLPTDTVYSADTWYAAEVAIDFEQQKFRWWIDGADKGSATLKTYDNITVAANDHLTDIWLTGVYAAAHAGYIDQLWVRKYIYPEPAWATATAEETETTASFGGRGFMRGVGRGFF